MPEYVKCNLCQSDDTKKLYVKDSFNIVRCRKCGLVYVNPRPTLEELKEFYKEKDAHIEPAKERDIFMHRFEKIIKIIEKFKNKGKLLDIGCSYGYFLELAQRHGWESYGVEISDYVSRYCREKLNLNVFTGVVSEAHYPDQHFDVITMFHTLEHASDPRNYLREINRILKRDGLLVVAVPNIESLKAKLTKKNWVLITSHEHLYYFSLKTLIQLLNETGFQPVKVGTSGGTYILTTIEKLGLRNLRQSIIKHFKYLAWAKNLLQHIQKLLRLQDVVIVYAKKKEDI